MFENRENSTLSAPAKGADRPEKASSCKAGTDGVEKSDRIVVPENQPNKGGAVGTPAEDGEGRVRTEENTSQNHTQPTLSGERVSQGLEGVRQAAKERKKERFTALLHHMTPALLRESFYALKREAAPGVDGVRWKEYEEGLSVFIPLLTLPSHSTERIYTLPERSVLVFLPSFKAHTVHH